MTAVNAKDAVFSLNGNDISAHVDSVDGIPPAYDTEDATTFGQAGRVHAKTLTNGTFTIGGVWNSTIDGILMTAYAAGEVAYVYGPAGSGTGARKHNGNCLITSVPAPSKVGGILRWTAQGQFSGANTVGAY